MKVWYCHPYAGSEKLGMSLRAFYLARSMKKANIDVTVFGSKYHHLFRTLPECNDYVEDGVPFHFFDTNRYEGNGLGRIVNMFVYALHFLRPKFLFRKKKNRPDVLIASSAHPFHFLSLFILSKIYKAKLVLEVRDLWPLSLNLLLGVKKSHPFYILVGLVERFAYRKADLVISLLKDADVYMYSQGLRPGRFLYLPNGVSTVELNKVQCELELRQEILEFRARYSRIFMYAGSHGVPNALDAFVKAADACEKLDGNIGFIFIGDGVEKANLVGLSKNLGSKNVLFLPSIPKREIPGTLSLSDICFIGAHHSEIYDYGISPNKLFDYMMAQKPVLSTISCSSSPISESACGWEVDARSQDDLVNSIIHAASLSDQELSQIGLKGREYIIGFHDYDQIASKFKHRIKSC